MFDDILKASCLTVLVVLITAPKTSGKLTHSAPNHLDSADSPIWMKLNGSAVHADEAYAFHIQVILILRANADVPIQGQLVYDELVVMYAIQKYQLQAITVDVILSTMTSLKKRNHT